MSWRLARSLEVLRKQVDAAVPGRSKSSDGAIGDESHASRSSDHNPWIKDGGGGPNVVSAIDITHDPAHGFDSYAFADMLLRNKDVRIKYCLIPGTRVLTSTLEWIGIEECEAGDELIAFDEYNLERPHPPNPYKNFSLHQMAGQKLRTAIVEYSEVIQRPCYEVVTDRGSVVASCDHMWLASRGLHGKYRTWVTTEGLKEGQPLQFFASPWAREDSFDAGWIAGILDGEGCLTQPKHRSGSKFGWILSIAQKDGDVLDRIESIMRAGGTQFSIYKNGPVRCPTIRGGLPEVLRFLGRYRSARLTTRAVNGRIWEGFSLNSNGSWPEAIIESVRPVGVQDVVAMQTSTRTFIAEGFFSHNCISNRRIASGAGEDKPAWVWRPYTGKNAHDHHVHISVKAYKEQYDSTDPWKLDMAAPAQAVSVPHDFTRDLPTLRRGSTGLDVEHLQELLNKHGFALTIDGHFGVTTDAAVRSFQSRNQIIVDGVVGGYTWRALA